MRKYLSTSIYTFHKIIEQNGMYIDKTKLIYKLVSNEIKSQYFLSRPRRFGKSLTLSTLEAIFLGKKELFKGLYIYDQPYEWKSYPIIRLALNKLSSDSAKELDTNFCFELKEIASQYNLQLEMGSSSQQFKELIAKLYKQSGPVVVLIDEYDKPILDNILEDSEVANVRALLKRFYGIIKASEEYLRFTFITGVSKFTQDSIFSDLNNLEDISMDEEFATLCGFTREECELYFKQWIDENAVKNEMSRDDYLAKLKKNYNGFRFSEKEIFVYNPVSYTNAMQHGNFKHYWFETGTPTFLLKMLEKRFADKIPELENLKLTSDGFSSYDIDRIKVEPLLYQTGYLTIKDYDKDSELFTLSYPNDEVRSAFVKRLSDYFTPITTEEAPALIEELRNALLANNLDEVFEILQLFYAKIDNSIKIKQEKYYQTIFYIMFTLLGYRIDAEVNTNKGRIDAVIQTKSHIYIFEFKLNKTAAEALEQIKTREYYQKFLRDERQLVLIGVAFNDQSGEIKDWIIE